MKKMRKFAALVLTVCMTVGLAACGAKSEETPAAAKEASADIQTESAGGDTYKIGMYQVMSGANAIYGEEALNALNMVVDEINSGGGLNGAKVEVVVYDDQGSPEEAVKAVTKLINVDKIDACISSCVSSCILASAGALNDA